MATLYRRGQRLLALALVCALSVTMVAPIVGANAAQDQSGLYIGAQATVANTGGAGVLQRLTASYDGAVVSSLADGTTVTITEGPVTDVSGQLWYGVVAMSAGYVPAFTLSSSSAAASAPTVAPDAAGSVTPEPTATTATDMEPVVSAESIQDMAVTLPPGTAMVTDTNGDGARCRVGAEYAAAMIVVVPEGTVVTIAGPVELLEWQPVICGESRYGYIHTDFVTYALGEDPDDVVALPVEPTTPPTAVVPTETVTPEVVATEVIATDAPATDETASETVVVETTEPEVESAEVQSTSADVSIMSTDMSVGAAAFTTGFVRGTNGEGVRCRSAASYSASTITVLAEGSAVTLRGAAQGEWQPVTCAGMAGFAHVSFINDTETAPSNGGTTPTTGSTTPTGAVSGSARITGTGGNGLNCRATASYSGSVIAILAEGAQVSLRGAAQGEWQPVTCAGMGGYVNTAFISSGTTTPPAPTAPSTGTGTANPGGAVTGSATVTGTNGSGLICRASASTSGGILMVMPEGSSVSLNGARQGDWQPVRCGSQSGFAFAGFLRSGGPSTPAPSTAPSVAPTAKPSSTSGGGTSLVGSNARVTASLNLRYSASYSSGVAAVAPSGTVVVVSSGPTNGFYRVDWDGLGGFMHSDYLVATSEAASERGGSAPAPTTPSKPTTPTSPAPPASGSGSSIVNYAMQYVGYPYVWGGAGPSSFDCSGYTKWVVQQVMGKNITQDMAVQISMGTPVARGSLQPGDLVFFQNTYKFGLSHAGIYIGNGQFVHAENENTGVRVSDINSQYYSSRWYGAARY